ncbi:hypothetical protein CSQ93_21685 [Janthinobacterium sp. BJB426]|uniref:hypothetical protein n=1 Tax=Janthinobacterium sp. BJB426 TaxID=2048010 RepID=UPI000C0E75F5|nr:hypothetical protein [Janthinobacterium sp. BJB426]PHV25832.1 hypothetical protein CSQ93_21685 [Janthinobacterium sp. BJB426]
MSTSTKQKAVRNAANPSYRAIQLAILAELCVHTALLTTLCQHRDDAVALRDFSEPQRPTAITPTAVSPSADPFAPTFEVTPSAGGYTATIAMREGSVVYLVNATGPRSNAVKVSAAGLLPILVAPVIEISQ